MKIEKVSDHLQELLKDPYFKELYELEEQKLRIVKRIIQYRIEHKISQKQLAARVGVTQQHISKIEAGEFSSIATLEKVLLFVGYTVKIEAVPLNRVAKNRLERFVKARK